MKVKPAKGWKLMKIRSYPNDSHYNITGERTTSNTVKQGGWVDLAKGQGMLEATFYNKAGKYYSSVILTAAVKAQNVNAALG